MSLNFAMKAVPFLACGLLLGFAPSCSKEKQEAAAAPTPATAPVVTMKEPGDEAVPAPTSTGTVTVRARFDGYAARVAKGLWQPVPLTAEVANFGLITPLEPISAGSGLVVEGLMTMLNDEREFLKTMFQKHQRPYSPAMQESRHLQH